MNRCTDVSRPGVSGEVLTCSAVVAVVAESALVNGE